jgi:hypothetical protein
MTGVSRGLDVLLDLVGAATWGFGTFVLTRWLLLSEPAAGLLGLAVSLSFLAWTLSTHLHELRMRELVAGVCPRCKSAVASEHRHRRWEPARREWLTPATSWQCASCGYSHSESWGCPGCPE